jgi:CelD/BcsL family acetyltransferase involved in cellulose biosynthesis
MDMASAPVATRGVAPVCASWREEEWCALAAHAAEPNPFYHPAILVPALRHLAEGAQVRLVEARDTAGSLIGLLPVLAKARHSRYPLGNVANWIHDQCFYGAPLLKAGNEVSAWGHILHQLDEAGWAGNFLHLDGVDEDGPTVAALTDLCTREQRGCKRIASHERALLRSSLDGESYWQAHVRAKKRKEIRRLANRLTELGSVAHRTLETNDDAGEWAEDFLKLEAAGWKGSEGTALASIPATCSFFRDAIRNAARDGLLDMLRIDLDGAALAMLVNFRLGEGAFSYKIAFDERFARFSPGVLIELDNMRAALCDSGLKWSDSCAAPNHPMIDGLWAERRTIAQFRIQLKGRGARRVKRRFAFAGIGFLESSISSLKGRRI